MPTADAQPDAPLGSLDRGVRLGSGGQGEVFRVRNRPGEVLKLYFRQVTNPDSLKALVDFPGSLDAADRQALLRQAAWPLGRVTKHGQVVGFLMKEVPAQFVGHTTAGPKLRELQYLLYPRKPLWGDIAPLDTNGRIEVAQAFVALLRILQENSMVIGDISMRNLLWSPGFPAQICMIDCDSPTRVGRRPVMPHSQTPDWTDPHMPRTGPDLDTDRYKVALVVGRILTGTADVRPGRPLSLRPDLPESIARPLRECFDAAAGAHGTRPDATRWARALSGRETILLAPPPPVRTPLPPLPMIDVDRRGPRGTIPLRPHSDSSG